MTPIHSDGANDNDSAITEDGAAELFLRQFAPEGDDDARKEPSEKGEETEPKKKKGAEDNESEADDEDKPDGDSDESPEDAEGEDESDDEDKSKRKYADDEGVYVKIKVGDEELEVPIKDLKRLHGQEASLTRKSQEVAERKKTLDTEFAKHTTATSVLLERAKERFEPYSKIDFLALAKDPNITAEDLTALQSQARAAWEDVQFYGSNLDAFMQAIQTKQHGELVETAKHAIEVLTGPVEKGGIEGWSDKVYDDVRGYAVAEGLDKDIVNKLVDPAAIKLIHKAMLYDKGKVKASKAPITTKVNKTPKKVVKTTTNPSASKDTRRTGDEKKVMDRLKRTGSTDAAVDVFMHRLTKDSDED